MKTCRARLADTLTQRWWTHLDDNLHEIFLGDHVLAVNDLLEDAWEDRATVHLEVDAFELAQPNQVRPDQDPKLPSLHLPPFAVARESRVLQSDPELVHLDKVGEDEADRVLEVAAGSALDR